MFQLHAVTADIPQSIEVLCDHIVALLPYVDYVQIREKKRLPKEIAQLIQLLLDNGADVDQLILNDRADIALAMGMHRVHLTESSLSLTQLSSVFPQLSLGRSFHSESQMMTTLSDYQYGYIGHIFPTQQKTYPPLGIKTLQQISMHKRGGQLIAIGGINDSNVHQVAPYVDGIAVMSGFFECSIEAAIQHAQRLKEIVWKSQSMVK